MAGHRACVKVCVQWRLPRLELCAQSWQPTYSIKVSRSLALSCCSPEDRTILQTSEWRSEPLSHEQHLQLRIHIGHPSARQWLQSAHTCCESIWRLYAKSWHAANRYIRMYRHPVDTFDRRPHAWTLSAFNLAKATVIACEPGASTGRGRLCMLSTLCAKNCIMLPIGQGSWLPGAKGMPCCSHSKLGSDHMRAACPQNSQLQSQCKPAASHGSPPA